MSQNVNVNLVPGNYPKEFHVSQYDVGRQLVANIVDSTGAYSIPSGATVTLVGTKPSGFGFTLSGSVGSGGVVTFSTTATVTAEYGRIPCEIRIESGNTVLGTANCMLIVEMSPHPEGTTDGDGEVIVNQITLLLEQITQQADRAVAASEAAQASETAAAASEANAASSESNAAASEATALSAKDDAVAAKTAAQASEQAAAESAAEARETLETYAKVDGEYDAMTVGTAKQLLSDSTTTDTEPYIYRQTVGDGDREEVEEVVGGTVAWNQLADNSIAPSSRAGVTITSSADSFTINGTTTGTFSASGWFGLTPALTAPMAGHKFFLRFQLVSGTVSNANAVQFSPTGRSDNVVILGKERIGSAPTTGAINNSELSCLTTGTAFTNAKMRLQFIDLTAMFGPTIADYIYSLEQATAGAGVAWFKKLFPKPYYAYNAGELMSVQASSHDMVGFNQWDEEWELGYYNSANGQKADSTTQIRSKNPIPVLPNTAYCITKPVTIFRIVEFDGDGAFIRAFNTAYKTETFITSENCHFIAFNSFTSPSYGTTYKNDICINLSDPSRNGTYEPYDGHTYPLPNVELRGIPKWVNGKLSYDGDVLEPSGKVTRKYGIVDLGSLTWDYNGTRFKSSQIPTSPSSERVRGVCSKYPLFNGSVADASDKSLIMGVGADDHFVYVKDSAYSDATAFKTAMNGVYLVYELATPTTETADPYTAIQVCDPNGTEEWIDERTVQIPVGNVTKYHANLKEKLEEMPAIPTAPSANGTYTLKATVSGGAVTYQWVNG